MIEISLTCSVCKKKFNEHGSSETNRDICPYCGSKLIKQNGLLNIFKLLCSGGG